MVNHFNIISELPIAANTNDADWKHDMKMIHGREAPYVFATLVTEILRKSGHRYDSQQSQYAFELESPDSLTEIHLYSFQKNVNSYRCQCTRRENHHGHQKHKNKY